MGAEAEATMPVEAAAGVPVGDQLRIDAGVAAGLPRRDRSG
jgi:hypothetical protein